MRGPAVRILNIGDAIRYWRTPMPLVAFFHEAFRVEEWRSMEGVEVVEGHDRSLLDAALTTQLTAAVDRSRAELGHA